MKKYLLILIAALFIMPAIEANAQNPDVYVVQKNDSLWKIAVRHEIGLSEIIAANPQIKNPSLIYPNQRINVPNIDATKSIEMQVLEATNRERRQQGLEPLEMDWQLQRVARVKSQDMIDKGYFSHTSPTYGSPFDMMESFNISYRSAGENIASGQTGPIEVVDAWMASAGHRKNILGDFTHIGIGYAKGGKMGHYWTQMFIKK